MTGRYSRKAANFAAFLLILLGHFGTADASVSISPIRVDLDAENDKGVIQIINQQDEEKSYQVEVVSWSQTDERKEVYSPTEDLVAVPPLFSLQPGEEQLIRIGMLTSADEHTERSYRMFITELVDDEKKEAAETGIRMRLQIGVPVFVAPTSMKTATLDFVDSMQIDDQTFLRFQNNGNTHVKVSEIQFARSGLHEKIVEPVVVYILPGQSGYLPLAIDDDSPVGTLTIITDTLGSVEYELPFAP